MEKKNNKQEHLLDLQWVRRALLLALIDAVIIALSSVIALMALGLISHMQELWHLICQIYTIICLLI